MEKEIKRGDIYFVSLTPGVGSEQNGNRPMLIIQNDIGNKHSKTVIAAVITSQVENKTKLPTHVLINAQQRLGYSSLVLLEQIKTIDKIRLCEYIGTLDDEIMRKVDAALSISVGL
jgi:mRNA interferase MazF